MYCILHQHNTKIGNTEDSDSNSSPATNWLKKL